MSRFWYFASFLIILSCGVSTQDSSNEERSGEQLLEHIEGLEEELFNTMASPDDSIAHELIRSYERFAEQDPGHEMAPEFLFRAANVARSFKEYDQALAFYQRILKNHGSYQNKIETEFLIAFMYDNDFKDKEKARAEYERISETYPDHIFGIQAAQRLEHIDLTDEELIELFERRREEASTDSSAGL